MALGRAASRSPASSGLLPLPGSPGSSWAVYKAKFKGLFRGADTSVVAAFWLFGLINNVSYVIILSAAVDLVGSEVPKGVVLLADVIPSFLAKLIAPYFIHRIPYSMRMIIICALSAAGMFLIALSPSLKDGGSIFSKLFGVAVASLASGGGELSCLGLTHYYGPFSLAAWGSGTGGAGLVGAGLYVLLTNTLSLSVKKSLLVSAFLPFIMPLAFFLVLPHAPLLRAHAENNKSYTALAIDEDIIDTPVDSMAEALLAPGPSTVAEAFAPRTSPAKPSNHSLMHNLRRARSLFFPYMLPLMLVYIAEYTTNQAILPTLLFPLPTTPFTSFREFYPLYTLLYQSGVFISRSSTPFLRIHNLYLPSFLQIATLFLLLLHSLYYFLPSVWIVFVVIFWEGLLGGAVYVNTFAEIMEGGGSGEAGENAKVDEEDREFSLGATSVSDSGGICVAGFIGVLLEPWLCQWNVDRGRGWCREVGAAAA